MAAVVTNSVFGFLRFAVLLAVVAAGARTVAGYDAPQLATFVWAGQGLIGVVLLWALTELADRIRTGDVVTDLLRPIDPVWQLARRRPRPGRLRVAHPLRRAGGRGRARLRPLRAERPVTYRCSRARSLLAMIVCFGCRYLVNAAAYWLLDVRGPQTAWTLASGRARRPVLSRCGSCPTRWRSRSDGRHAVPVDHPDAAGRAGRARLAAGCSSGCSACRPAGRGAARAVPLGAAARRAQAGDPGWLDRDARRPTASWWAPRCASQAPYRASFAVDLVGQRAVRRPRHRRASWCCSG